MKITPQEALERIQNNTPTSINRKGHLGWESTAPDLESFEIDWPKGVSHWPPKKWRVPTEADALFRPIARFSEDPNDSWIYGYGNDRILLAIVSFPEHTTEDRFVSYEPNNGHTGVWKYCEIEDTTPEVASGPDNHVVLTKGDMVRITRNPTNAETMTTGGWLDCMDDNVGKIMRVSGQWGDDPNRIILDDFLSYPTCILEKVDPDPTRSDSALRDHEILITGDWLESSCGCSKLSSGRYYMHTIYLSQGNLPKDFWTAHSNNSSHTHFLCKLRTRQDFLDFTSIINRYRQE